jgi:hypothetical protein
MKQRSSDHEQQVQFRRITNAHRLAPTAAFA